MFSLTPYVLNVTATNALGTASSLLPFLLENISECPPQKISPPCRPPPPVLDPAARAAPQGLSQPRGLLQPRFWGFSPELMQKQPCNMLLGLSGSLGWWMRCPRPHCPHAGPLSPPLACISPVCCLPTSSVKPDPPEDLRVSPVPGEPKKLLLEWSPPGSWPFPEYFPLKYRIRYVRDEDLVTRTVPQKNTAKP